MSENMSKSPFSKGCATFGDYLTGKETSPTNQCWYQKTRVIAVLCGIKIAAVHYLVLSQYTRLTDRQTDGRTDRQTERIATTQSHVKTLKRDFVKKVKTSLHL